MALRDESADEKSAPAKVVSGMAGAVLGVGDTVIGTSAKLVQPVIPKKKGAESKIDPGIDDLLAELEAIDDKNAEKKAAKAAKKKEKKKKK